MSNSLHRIRKGITKAAERKARAERTSQCSKTTALENSPATHETSAELHRAAVLNCFHHYMNKQKEIKND